MAAVTLERAIELPPSVPLSEEAAPRIDRVFAAIGEMSERLLHIERLLDLLPVLLAGNADPTHVTIPQAARILGVSERTIRRKITRGDLRLDVIAGTKVSGIEITQLYGKWISLAASRRALQREKQQHVAVTHDEQE